MQASPTFFCGYFPESPECETCIIKSLCPKRGKVEWQPTTLKRIMQGVVKLRGEA
jgi:hypothetical protein